MHDVVIAGGGPVGLFLAGELALSGCSVLVLERDPELTSPLKALPLGLRGLNAGSAETLYRRGLLETMAQASGVNPQKVGADPEAVEAPDPRELSHFAGMTLDAADIDTAALPSRLPSPAMEGFMTSLEAVGSVLYGRATALGVEIIRKLPSRPRRRTRMTVDVYNFTGSARHVTLSPRPAPGWSVRPRGASHARVPAQGRTGVGFTVTADRSVPRRTDHRLAFTAILDDGSEVPASVALVHVK